MQILLFLNTSLFTGNGRSKQWEKRKKYTKQTIYKISSSDITHSLRIKLSFRCASCSLGILKLNINWHSETIFFYYHSCYYYYYYYRINKLKQWMKQKLNWDLTKITVTGSRRKRAKIETSGFVQKIAAGQRIDVLAFHTPLRRRRHADHISVANRPDLLLDIRHQRRSPLIWPPASVWSFPTDAAVRYRPPTTDCLSASVQYKPLQLVHFYS